MKKYLLLLLMGVVAHAGEIGQSAATLEWNNWLTANDVRFTENVKLFLALPDAVPIDPSSGLLLPSGQYRTSSPDRLRGWTNKIIRRLHVEENGRPAYWVYHIETTLVFDLMRSKE